MSKQPKLAAEKRTLTGRKVKQLRREGVLPANVYGKNVKSFAVQVDNKEFSSMYKEVGETSLVDLVVGKKSIPVLVNNTHLDPVTDEYLHVDFLQVNLKEKVKAHIPLELVGDAPAEKTGLGTLVQQLDEVEVEALPTDLPDKFEVDVSSLDDTEKVITVADIKVDSKKVEMISDKELFVAKVEEVKEVEEEPVVAEGEETPAESETPAEGGEAKTEEGGEEKASEDTPEK